MAGPNKVSTGGKKTGQKYQNSHAFIHNRNSKKTRTILALPVNGLCKRCYDVIQWRKTYRKYKPLTVAKKCVRCEQKKVREAYHILCRDCARDLKVCAKCQTTGEIIKNEEKTPQELAEEQRKIEDLLSNLTERKRRAYQRRLARGEELDLDQIAAEGSDDDDFDFSDSAEEDSAAQVDSDDNGEDDTRPAGKVSFAS
ncbi:hypothetical protein IWQ60_004990 [Tieghemiomyces parasiticus]|uniref:Uncharacterized protein n=1 Tax=Tieghemiomyces parasiticus TaxID=78921 RepID=A0A9W8A4B5_9FUNG|nr:hypothetical protein IWQ60_006447 [Tieghemiomyces parasiticus]KAJ1924760.1 hypothetical protein IWQ60_004990 [Tieghemiomyces parasiticus]